MILLILIIMRLSHIQVDVTCTVSADNRVFFLNIQNHLTDATQASWNPLKDILSPKLLKD